MRLQRRDHPEVEHVAPRVVVDVIELGSSNLDAFDWSEMEPTMLQLAATNALVPPDEAEETASCCSIPTPNRAAGDGDEAGDLLG